jgi:uncharacterized protein
MLARVLVPLCWTLWSALVVVALYGLFKVSTERTSSPEAGRALGIWAVLFVMLLLAGVAVGLNAAARRQSVTWLVVIAVVLVWPLVSMIAHPAMVAYKERRFARAEASVGDFRDPALKPMAEAVRTGDAAALRQLLKGQPPPLGKDRAGHDLLAYALVLVRDRQGSAEPVRALLEAGADPRASRGPKGEDLVNFMVYGGSPAAAEAMRLILQHGADPNAVDPASGKTPINSTYGKPQMVRALADHGADIDRIQPGGVTALIELISTREWESALYLVEKGASLDVRNEHGLSVDYYLNEWKDSVHGEHPEGWDRVREAIARRRAARK